MTRMSTVVLFGPALPGRDLLARTLAKALPAGTRLIVGDLPTTRERVALARQLAADGAHAVFVAREPIPDEGWREVFHHYAGLPLTLAELRWDAFCDDVATREPAEGEVQPTIVVRGTEPLDRVVASIAARLDAAGSPPTPGPHRVLVVDDDPAQLELVGDALRDLGCTITTASSAEEALALALAAPFDLVISDERMAGATGTELAGMLSRVQPDLRVAIVTGFPDAAVQTLPRGPNVDVVLAKPLGIADLIHLVDEMARPTVHVA